MRGLPPKSPRHASCARPCSPCRFGSLAPQNSLQLSSGIPPVQGSVNKVFSRCIEIPPHSIPPCAVAVTSFERLNFCARTPPHPAVTPSTRLASLHPAPVQVPPRYVAQSFRAWNYRVLSCYCFPTLSLHSASAKFQGAASPIGLPPPTYAFPCSPWNSTTPSHYFKLASSTMPFHG